VGGMAAVLQGAPVHTIDLDIVHALSEPNVIRLELALTELRAIFRYDPRRIVPDRSHLQSRGRKLLQTAAGPLDLLPTSETATTFEDLLPDSDWLEVDGARFRVLSLARLIEPNEGSSDARAATRDPGRAQEALHLGRNTLPSARQKPRFRRPFSP